MWWSQYRGFGNDLGGAETFTMGQDGVATPVSSYPV